MMQEIMTKRQCATLPRPTMKICSATPSVVVIAINHDKGMVESHDPVFTPLWQSRAQLLPNELTGFLVLQKGRTSCPNRANGTGSSSLTTSKSSH
jgi:hypothetical protein